MSYQLESHHVKKKVSSRKGMPCLALLELYVLHKKQKSIDEVTSTFYEGNCFIFSSELIVTY